LQVLLVLVFVVAVAFGAWFFGYGLSLIRDQSSDTDLEPQVPDAPRDATQEKRPQAAGEVQVGRLTDPSTTAITAVAKPGTRLDEPRDA
jgi:hypothetical protein